MNTHTSNITLGRFIGGTLYQRDDVRMTAWKDSPIAELNGALNMPKNLQFDINLNWLAYVLDKMEFLLLADPITREIELGDSLVFHNNKLYNSYNISRLYKDVVNFVTEYIKLKSNNL